MATFALGVWPYSIIDSLVRTLSPRAAPQLILTGCAVSAADALQMEIAYRVVAEDRIDQEIDDLLGRLRRGSRNRSP